MQRAEASGMDILYKPATLGYRGRKNPRPPGTENECDSSSTSKGQCSCWANKVPHSLGRLGKRARQIDFQVEYTTEDTEDGYLTNE